MIAQEGYFLMECERPREHVWIVSDVGWEEARARAALEFHRQQLRAGN